MPKLTIDGMDVTVEPGTSVLQAAEQLGIEIPRFCFHDRLSVPANCRMCLVEVEKAPKLMASCAMPCGDNMVVHTGTDKVKEARRGVMEFLLINHPLDCPICDQGGECDLQDQAVAFGYDRSRYQEEKRATKDKDLGPLVKTVMTRCIHCTRCVRFGSEIAGVDTIGVIGRGEHLEIGTYVDKAMESELSGNLIDVCPVGALTSKPYEFTARPWELKKTETIDVLDAVGSNIRIDTRGTQIMRILPRLNEAVNEEWISDKTRFSYDGLKNCRLDTPYVRNAKGKLKPASWEEAFDAIAGKVMGTEGNRIAAITGDLCDAESMVALKDLMVELDSPHTECRQDGARFDVTDPAGYRFNTGIEQLEYADVILLVGTNPRWDAAMINARIRKGHLNHKVKVGVIGERLDLNYPYEYLGAGVDSLSDVMKGKSDFAKALKKAERPAVILGAGATIRKDGADIQNLVRQLADQFKMIKPKDDWNGFNMLHTAASRMGALEIGFVPGKNGYDRDAIFAASAKGKLDVLYLLGADDLPFDKLGKDTFVIYQGHHGDHGAMHADVILPGAAYTEKHGIYVNTEGCAQIGRPAMFPPAQAMDDWKIIRALSEIIGHTLPYNHLGDIRSRLADLSETFDVIRTAKPAKWSKAKEGGKIAKAGFKSPINIFYQTCTITRASKTMANCTKAFVDVTGKKVASNA